MRSQTVASHQTRIPAGYEARHAARRFHKYSELEADPRWHRASLRVPIEAFLSADELAGTERLNTAIAVRTH
jgi:hypothetical protein